ncbi:MULTISPECIES: DUF4350 domain-containing protein [unclassified Pseudofrankia]|uniref:DUF4350 domain-containing protein n=1 Tax=unclassified Pseudofrankia TaxID=2994372 RepID=UPI0008D9D904|nr:MULTISPECIES: DUF4350 domain-containing protein [unclassified Pseudofrankia]MDT3439004.1 DUF4350 domain-containing protein [Pseudofrankia sp. BMG5.37]OHV50607.1 hypothetical protein BCD48_01135 [Pseudofrankia sp. BMG5.36]
MTAPTAPAPAPPGQPAGTPGAGGPGGPGPTGSTFQQSGPRPATRRRVTIALAVVGVVVVAYSLLAVAIGQPSSGGKESLDTRSPAPAGTMALAEILRHRGIDVTPRDHAWDALTAPGDAADLTMVVIRPGRLDRYTLGNLRQLAEDGADVVLVGANANVLAALDVPVDTVDTVTLPGAKTPACELAEARTAGRTTISGSVHYDRPTEAPEGPAAGVTATFCYAPPAGGAPLAVVTAPSWAGRLVLLSGAGFLTNADLDREGNAALALGLLARHSHLDWVIQEQVLTDPADRDSVADLLGPGFWLTCLQILVALVLLALWRGRRLGPPVPEPLPVVVRAAETTEGRGRLYSAARARGLAAEALRAGLRARLADRLGLPPHSAPGAGGTVRAGAVAKEISGPDPAALVASVVARTGRPPVKIWALLYGSGWSPAAQAAPPAAVMPAPGAWPAPPAGGPPAPGPQQPEPLDDAALVRLAKALDKLDRQVGGR